MNILKRMALAALAEFGKAKREEKLRARGYDSRTVDEQLADHDVTTLTGMRNLFGVEYRKAREKLRTRN